MLGASRRFRQNDCVHFAEIALSVALGLATSFVFFYWQFHLVVPRVRFSDKISKLPAGDVGNRYRVKYENCGSRAMIEVTLMARLRVKGVRKDLPLNWGVATIPMESITPRVASVKTSHIRHVPELELWKTEFDRTFPGDVVEHTHNGTMTLEELLSCGTSSELRVYLFAYDEFSGARKVFESKVYGVADVVEGAFEPYSLEIVPRPVVASG